jgi:surface protein
VNNGVFVQNLLDKPSSDIGLPRGISIQNSVALPYYYPGDDNWRIDKTKIVLVFDTRYGTNTSVTIPPIAGSNLVVDWGDGTIRPYSLGTTYSYASHGIYIVQIGGSATSFGNISSTDPNRLKLIKCLSLGTTATSLSYAFSNASVVGHPNLVEAPDVLPSGCTSLLSAFAGCFQFNDPKIKNWNTSQVTNMQSTFNSAALFNQPLDSWDVSNVVSFNAAFQSTRFNQPISSWNTSKVINMGAMFNFSQFNQDINNWDTSEVTAINSMFANSPFNQPIGNWNVSKVTNFNNLFFSSSSNGPFNQDLSNWTINTNLAASVDMSFMFRGCAAFNNAQSSGINNWNTSRVTNMNSMFLGCFAFNQPLNNWNVSNVSNFSSMFNSASSFNSSLSGWALGADTVGTTCNGMFQSATTFNQDISTWDTTKVTNMSAMFRLTAFNQNISGWNVSNVTDMNLMFGNATVFNQPIGSWNVSKVTNMNQMFNAATAFDQDLSSWNLAGLNANTALDFFLGNKTYSTANYNALLIGWNNNKLVGANGVANWRTDLRPNFGSAKYTSGGAAATARAALVSYGWTITDGGIA